MFDDEHGRPLLAMPGFWLTVVFGLAFAWSVRRDRKTI